MVFFKNVPIFRRFFLLFALFAVVPIIVIALLSNFFLTSLSTRSQAVQTSVDAQSLASSEQGNLQRMHEEMQTRFNEIFASLSGKITDPALPNAGGLISSDIAARQAVFAQNLTTYQATYNLASSSTMDSIRSILINDSPSTGPAIIADQQQALDDVTETLWPTYQKLLKQEVQQLDSLDPTLTTRGQTADLNTTFTSVYKTLWQTGQAFTNLQNSWQRVVDDAAVTAKTVTTVGASETNPILIGSAVAAFGILTMAVLIGYMLNITIVSPLRSLALLTRRIAQGDTSARAKMTGRDEIALVAVSMNKMLDNIVHLIQDAQRQHDLLQAQVEKLVGEVSGVGEGDLRVQAEVTTDALGVLADSFNYMVEELSGLVVRVKMVAHEVGNSTAVTFERMGQLVESADTQIQRIGQAELVIERMADSIQQVAERTQVLYTSAYEARQTAQTGREAVQQTVDGMDRVHSYVQQTSTKVQALGESSQQITTIVGVISQFAHQTNRLALDAAIQAAMAGENGKGFAAVAAEIRKLAEHVKEEASTIARIVRSVRDDIGAAAVSMLDTERETSEGAHLAQQAGAALESIYGVVERQALEIEAINTAAMQQLQLSDTGVQIIQNVSASTQQSSGSTRATAQQVESIARLTEQLLASVEAFKLRDDLGYFAAMSVPNTPYSEYTHHLTTSGIFRSVSAAAASQSQALPAGYYSNNGDMNHPRS